MLLSLTGHNVAFYPIGRHERHAAVTMRPDVHPADGPTGSACSTFILQIAQHRSLPLDATSSGPLLSNIAPQFTVSQAFYLVLSRHVLSSAQIHQGFGALRIVGTWVS
jgi:hypothetical protein